MENEVTLLLKKATAGDEAAIQSLFDLFQQEKLSRQDQEEIYLYVKGAAEHHADAIYLHAWFYDVGFFVKQNEDMAFLLMREAAAIGHARAIYEVGRRFLIGLGVNQQYQSAKQWLEIAANSPHYVNEAMYDLARMYEAGFGVQVDLAEARVWYERAAERGHTGAKAKLL